MGKDSAISGTLLDIKLDKLPLLWYNEKQEEINMFVGDSDRSVEIISLPQEGLFLF